VTKHRPWCPFLGRMLQSFSRICSLGSVLPGAFSLVSKLVSSIIASVMLLLQLSGTSEIYSWFHEDYPQKEKTTKKKKKGETLNEKKWVG